MQYNVGRQRRFLFWRRLFAFLVYNYVLFNGGIVVSNTKDDIRMLIGENDVKFIRLQFTDMFGALKNIAVTVSQLEKVLDGRCMLTAQLLTVL